MGDESINQAVLNSLADQIAVLDTDGCIIAVNEAWKRFAFENGGASAADGVGLNYLETCRRAADQGDAEARKALDGIQAVLEGSLPRFALEYPCHSPDTKRWFLMSATPLSGYHRRSVVTHSDITARRLIEEALRESEQRLGLAMEAGEIGTFDWHVPTNDVIWTEQSKPTFGKPLTASAGVYQDWATRLYREDLAACEASIQDAFRKKDHHWRAEYRLMGDDAAEPRWVSSQSHIFYDSQGEPQRMIGINMDITERKKTEQALRKSAEQIRDLYNHAPCGYHSLDKDGVFVQINDTELEWLGYTREEVIDKMRFTGLLTAQSLQTFQTNFPRFMDAGKIQDLEFDLIRKNGTIMPVLLSATAIKDSTGNYLEGRSVLYNITERKQAEKALEYIAERIRRLQAVTDSAVRRFSLEDLLKETLGRVGELLETDSAAILLLTDDERSLVVRAAVGEEEKAIGLQIPLGEGIAGSIAASRSSVAIEDISAFTVVNPILRQSIRSLIGAPLIVEGRLRGVIHADSVKTRRFTENDLRLLQLAADRIALAIEQTRLYEIEKEARLQAEESNRMKDEFLALVSHELRSPLSAILGYARLLRFGPLDAQKVKTAVDVIERNGNAQTQLIDDLLDTARIISGKLRLDVGPVDLVEVIESAVQTIWTAAEAKDITIETDLNPKAGQITGDPERLQQVVWNLLSNAVKFTPAGGRVAVRLERVDPHICITVRDTGKGIRRDFLPYVFDRFRQADASSSRRYGGLGLGLALVKYLVELHGGTVEALSEGEGKGASFKVLLPVRAVSGLQGEIREAPAAAAGPEKVALAGVRALVVDDEDDARDLVKTVIAQYGADVVSARSASEAFALIAEAPEKMRPDVMVTDLGMPGEDGYSLLRRVREWEHEHDAYIPAVALTAYGRSEDRKRALMAGFQMYVAKPVEPDELAVVIASVIHRPGRE
jgi:PAS domain S-box-containing protein